MSEETVKPEVTPEQQLYKDRMIAFITEFKERVQQFIDANGSRAGIPAYWNGIQFIWANRARRRNMRKSRRLKNGKPRKQLTRRGYRAK